MRRVIAILRSVRVRQRRPHCTIIIKRERTKACNLLILVVICPPLTALSPESRGKKRRGQIKSNASSDLARQWRKNFSVSLLSNSCGGQMCLKSVSVLWTVNREDGCDQVDSRPNLLISRRASIDEDWEREREDISRVTNDIRCQIGRRNDGGGRRRRNRNWWSIINDDWNFFTLISFIKCRQQRQQNAAIVWTWKKMKFFFLFDHNHWNSSSSSSCTCNRRSYSPNIASAEKSSTKFSFQIYALTSF